MKKLVMVLVVILSVASVAQAAGPANNWSGFYVGINGGQARVESGWTDIDYDWYGGTLTTPFNATVYGVTAGFNKQSGNIVYGLEFDWDTSSKKQETAYDSYYYDRVSSATSHVLKVDDFKEVMTLRGRVGVAVDNGLFYLTMGVAKPKVEHTWTEFDDETDSWPTFTNNKVGYAIGFGFEHKIGPKFSWKIEYLNTKNEPETGRNGYQYQMQVDEKLDIIRLGLNFHFGK